MQPYFIISDWSLLLNLKLGVSAPWSPFLFELESRWAGSRAQAKTPPKNRKEKNDMPYISLFRYVFTERSQYPSQFVSKYWAMSVSW